MSETMSCSQCLSSLGGFVERVLHTRPPVDDDDDVRTHLRHCLECGRTCSDAVRMTTADPVKTLADSPAVGAGTPVPAGMRQAWRLCLDCCNRDDDQPGASQALDVLASVERNSGDVDESMRLYRLALETWEGDET